MRQTEQVYRNKWGGDILKRTKGEWGTQHIGISGCDIQNSNIKLSGEIKMYTDVVIV